MTDAAKAAPADPNQVFYDKVAMWSMETVCHTSLPPSGWTM